MKRLQILLALAVVFSDLHALANERHFTYTYESAVLPPGARELEFWTTPRIGRDHYFVRMDQRLELEFGLTDRLMTAVYWNFSTRTQAVADTEVLQTSFSFGSFSSEWKLKLLDPAADALGLAVYAEFTGATNELEVEGKLILDKRLGDLLIAGNLVFEHEWEIEEEGETERAIELKAIAAGSYFFSESLAVGLELRAGTKIPGGGRLDHMAFFAGPVVSYARPTWWLSATILPQIFATGGGDEQEGVLNLDEYERIEARLLLGLHL